MASPNLSTISATYMMLLPPSPTLLGVLGIDAAAAASATEDDGGRAKARDGTLAGVVPALCRPRYCVTEGGPWGKPPEMDAEDVAPWAGPTVEPAPVDLLARM